MPKYARRHIFTIRGGNIGGCGGVRRVCGSTRLRGLSVSHYGMAHAGNVTIRARER